jgi:hypothetical protein
MPINLQKDSSDYITEHSYHLVSADNLQQLSQNVSKVLNGNFEESRTFIATIKGGPVYDSKTEKWYQAYVTNVSKLVNYLENIK